MARSQALSPQQAASILLERRKARADLTVFASRVPVPGCPADEPADDAVLPLIETEQAEHHRLILRAMQRTMETRHGRLMVMAPPGSAKSTYATVVAPSWYLGKHSDRRVILSSYGEDLARRHGRRTRQLLGSTEAQGILQTTIRSDSRAADDFALENGSEYIAVGVLAGITGTRAHGIVIDDPVKGRQDADSQTVRDRVWAAYQDDLLTRLIPGGWVVVIMTRWHEDDLAGRILPVDWGGESGLIECRDGNVWEVLCLQAECQRPESDPMGRAAGGMLWPEWFSDRHWGQFRSNRRTWSSLYQQRPAPDDGILFRRDDMPMYSTRPHILRIIGASDYACTPDGGDWTEHGIAGIGEDGSMYLLDWWRGQTGPEVWIEKMLDMVADWRPLCWFGESGPIRRSIEGTLKRRMAERQCACRMEWMASATDKASRAQSIIGLAGMGRLWWPNGKGWTAELQRQCLVFPAGNPDDGVDVLSLLGRGMDMLGAAFVKPPIKPPPVLRPHGARSIGSRR
jgi:predicted phage terminase large subunit-like protein